MGITNLRPKANTNTSGFPANRAQRRLEHRAWWLVDTPEARNRTIEQNYADGYRSRTSLDSFFLAAFEAAPVILYMFVQRMLDRIQAKLESYLERSEEVSSVIDVLIKQRLRLALKARISSRLKGDFIKSTRSIPLSRDAIPIASA